MEDFKFLFYIILAILYFIITNYKKFKKKSETDEADFPHPEGPPVSFEEVLKQHLPKKTSLNNTTEKANRPAPAASAERAYNLEKSDRRALSLEKKEELAEARRRSARAEQQRLVKEKVSDTPVHPLAALLRNPVTARNAIILSEVLKRKEY